MKPGPRQTVILQALTREGWFTAKQVKRKIGGITIDAFGAAFHLNRLASGGLAQRMVRVAPDCTQYSVYRLSEAGELFLKALHDGATSQPSIVTLANSANPARVIHRRRPLPEV